MTALGHAGVVLPSPRPGIGRDQLLQTLRDRHTELVNLRGGGGPGAAQDRIRGYLEWVTNAVRHLTYQVSGEDVDRLVLTRGYDRLLAASTMTGTDIGTQRVLNGMLSLELDQRVQAFEAAITAVREQIARWPLTRAFVVPDTSFYIEHPDKLEDADFHSVLGLPGMPVHVLVPIVVVDELDGLKKAKDRDSRWRAAYTLAVLDRVLATAADHSLAGTVGAADGDSGFTIEILFDPPGHVRLPISDDEIISRVQAIEPLAGRQVALVTYDTGQATRGRAAGLRVRKLDKRERDPRAGITSQEGRGQ